jgi:hypothetical protein
MDNTTLIDQLADEVDNLFHIYQALAVHIDDGSRAVTRLRSQEVRQLGTTIQRLDGHVQTLSRQRGLDQAQDVRPESGKTYTVTYSVEGWRLHFQPDIAPHFGLESRYRLREVIERVGNLHPEYRPQLITSQLKDYAFQLNVVVDANKGAGTEFTADVASALIRCAPTDLPASKRIVLQEQAEKAFRTGEGLSDVIKQLTQLRQKKQHNQTYQRAQTL